MAYFTRATMVAFTPDPVYPFYSARSMCEVLGTALVEPADEAATLHLAQTMIYGASLLGFHRNSSTESFLSLSTGKEIGFLDIFPGGISTAENLCLKVSASQVMEDAHCSDWLQSISCEVAVSALPHGSVVLPLNLSLPAYVRESDNQTFGWAVPMLIFPATHVAWISQSICLGEVAYGLSIQLALRQCTPAVELATSSAEKFKVSYIRNLCQLDLDGSYPIRVYQDVLTNATFSTTDFADHNQLTFSFVLWTDSRARNIWKDVETGHVYAFITLSTNSSWDEAYSNCRALGAGWTLADTSPSSVRAFAMTPSLWGSSVLPTRLVRGVDGVPGIWDHSNITMVYAQEWPFPLRRWDAAGNSSEDCIFLMGIGSKAVWNSIDCKTPAIQSRSVRARIVGLFT